MKRASKFLIPPNWQVLLNDLEINLEEALAYAQLPSGLFSQDKVYLTPAQYFQLWQGVETAANGIELPLKLAEVMTIESFDVPIFAAICSPNLNAALARLQQYKPLIGPMELALEITNTHTKAQVSCYGFIDTLPKCYSLAELVFFTQLTRLATRKQINPVTVIVPELPEKLMEYEAYFGCPLRVGNTPSVTFLTEDAKAPFLTSNQVMLSCFEGDLKRKLQDVISEQSLTDKVSSILFKSLPQGQSNIEHVASELALSKRSLQRKLTAEKQSYQKVLQQVREDLAQHYLMQTELPIIEIAFLLGFSETNSFVRAYSSWTGVSPAHKRTQVRH
ncbi:MAG: AraC family transcriptional regulator [Pseudoalteromonas sp.]|uniref:AraC family transcriptional regulator n=1 Tax=Pseudoalteromonas sp. TaxID=53249 RepID=UPI0025FA3D9A|nr:AraC family transcriptional regulator [Pseudoalteromonas sp.]MCH2088438.1 AraC family transcriptional regulator [Pseudoalteromonas sp.]